MCDGHLRNTDTVARRTEMTSTCIRPLHLAAYHAIPNVRETEKEEIEMMLEAKVIEPAQT